LLDFRAGAALFLAAAFGVVLFFLAGFMAFGA
jgi:hypothetical protein